MAIKKFKKSSILTDVRYDSMLAGYPGVMAAPTATDGGTGTTASVAFTTVSGSTGYTALSNPGSLTGTGTSSPITVSGLTSGTAYTFQVRAQNTDGNGAYSAASNSVTPIDPASFESIMTSTATGSTTITLSSIPSGYKHLQVRAVMRTTGTTGVNNMQINGDTGSNYARHYLRGTGSSVTAAGQTSQTSMWMAHELNATNFLAPTIIDILDYTSTSKYKTVRAFTGYEYNSTDCQILLTSGLWMSTSAITSLTFIGGSNFASGTQIALYGIKG